MKPGCNQTRTSRTPRFSDAVFRPLSISVKGALIDTACVNEHGMDGKMKLDPERWSGAAPPFPGVSVSEGQKCATACRHRRAEQGSPWASLSWIVLTWSRIFKWYISKSTQLPQQVFHQSTAPSHYKKKTNPNAQNTLSHATHLIIIVIPRKQPSP